MHWLLLSYISNISQFNNKLRSLVDRSKLDRKLRAKHQLLDKYLNF